MARVRAVETEFSLLLLRVQRANTVRHINWHGIQSIKRQRCVQCGEGYLHKPAVTDLRNADPKQYSVYH